MIISYEIEFDNSKEVNFSDLITEIFNKSTEAGRAARCKEHWSGR